MPRELRALAERFGGETGDETDKLAGCAWHAGPGGAPILEACPSWLAGRILDRIALGDHTGFLLEPLQAHDAGGAFTPLRVRDAADIEPGHEA